MNINLTLISQAIAFAVFIWFTVKFVWPPMLTAITERQKKIEEGLAAAERSKKDLELAQARSTDTLREAREKSTEMIGGAERQAAHIIEDFLRPYRAIPLLSPQVPRVFLRSLRSAQNPLQNISPSFPANQSPLSTDSLRQWESAKQRRFS